MRRPITDSGVGPLPPFVPQRASAFAGPTVVDITPTAPLPPAEAAHALVFSMDTAARIAADAHRAVAAAAQAVAAVHTATTAVASV